MIPALLLAAAAAAVAQDPAPSAAPPPDPAAVRAAMGIPSRGAELRGQRDTVGFASTAAQMARAWELAGGEPAPEALGPPPPPGVAGAICPHDDYLYAGRVERRVAELVTARTVVLVGVFHGYRRFGLRDRLVFDPYAAWRSPDGPIPVSPLRAEALARLPAADFVVSAAMHDSEHSVEAVAYWLRHADPELEILPVIVPAMGFARMRRLAADLAAALRPSLAARGWRLGREVAVVISSDAVHYGPDFGHTPFGPGGIEAYTAAREEDLRVMREVLGGPLGPARAEAFFATCVDPERPDDYRLTWCGRFSVPFGLLLLDELAAAESAGPLAVRPLWYQTTVGLPELDLRPVGLGETAPANLWHFVGAPGLAVSAPAGAG